MLKALYDYGVQNGLVNVPGFAEKAIYAYIVLSKNGDFIRIESCQNEKRKCPDIGSLAKGTDKCSRLLKKQKLSWLWSLQKQWKRHLVRRKQKQSKNK